jgi:tRNA 2-thiouridine synthesizing protein B
MLFTVNKSPLTTNHLESCLRIAPKGTPILLYEDGVYGAAKATRVSAVMTAALADHPVYALRADLEARGVRSLLPEVQVINYEGFVELVEQHDVAPWL